MANVLRGSTTQTTDAPEAAPLERARSVATLLDESVRVPVVGYRVGLDPLLGIAPISGDVIAAVVSLYIVYAGVRIGVPKRKLVWMLGRVGVDLAVGSIPIVGTLVDAVWKNNKRNVAVIESHVESA
ncbi:hypothetical protein C475_21549 [Halosimplex carlsbadense 2-9-1]|uniref:DUF4112 domain-containing protein n=1 Tax=Halosimplex carlsbadense 2-9-1 TaxID=797114 RepID=M0C9G9_9EURY|nr:DUF4112 domain-containing protein [Halosimplex carlsbadense]ELZ19926.1 hypothetical protein C475_21549 [Halosimplex carlsbadense 2-9-1]